MILPHVGSTGSPRPNTASEASRKTKDGTEQTVVGIQVENEPGIMGSDRDYGPQAQAEFDSPVPAKILTAKMD